MNARDAARGRLSMSMNVGSTNEPRLDDDAPSGDLDIADRLRQRAAREARYRPSGSYFFLPSASIGIDDVRHLEDDDLHTTAP